ncbi:glycosyltransferase [Bacillus sp. Marseille-Q1617]|uniref:glycosyltransferase n=1 Tax=Bacillus sp. Marseille-Q1617 TaxID=2736887 RepID=UPI0015883C1D|nr:glycosyltransferase [Bacillus sp. Marseille-Q1617]
MNARHTVMILPQFDEPRLGMEDKMKCEERSTALFKQNLNLITLLRENDGDPIPVIMNPLVLGFFSTDEFIDAADSFLQGMLRREEEKEKWVHIYSQWMGWNKNLSEAYKKLLEEGKTILIPTSLNSIPLTHYRTSIGMEVQVKVSIEMFKKYLGVSPDFFWLPQAAYLPGLDLYLLKEGIEASFISSFSYKFSEKEMGEAETLRSPRGLKLIPVFTQDPQEQASKENPQGISLVTLKLDGCEKPELAKLHSSSLHSWLNAPCSLARIGFGYLGMEDQTPILQDPAMRNIRKVHEMELGKVQSDMEVTGSEFHQLSREFIYALQRLNEKELDISYFNRIASLITAGNTDDHFFYHRNKVNPIPSSELLDLCIGERKSNSQVENRDAVLILSWEYPPNIVGGLSRHVYDLANNLVKKGKKVHVLTARSKDSLSYEKVEGVTIHRVHPLHPYEENFFKWVFDLNQSFVQHAHELISQENITHIHAHDWIVSTSAIKLKELHSLPLITTIHATEHGRNQGIYTELQQKIHKEEQMLISASDHLIVCSDHMKEEVKSLFTFEAPIEVIPNGVEIEKLEHLPTDHSMEESRPFFFSIGRMVHEKGFETLIRAASLLKGEGHEVSFIIAGKGPMLEHYRQMVQNENLDDMVFFTGFISDEKRNSYLKNCLAVIFPSLYEPFGIVALEAMACRKGVVASDTGGLKSIVKHEHTGLVFQPDNEVNLYTLLLSLINDPGKSERLGEMGFRMAKSMFSWERIADQTMHVYEDVLLQTKVEGLR